MSPLPLDELIAAVAEAYRLAVNADSYLERFLAPDDIHASAQLYTEAVREQERCRLGLMEAVGALLDGHAWRGP